MARERFIATKFKNATKALIETANKFLVEMAAEGYSVTARQLYYQLVTLNLIPNSAASYKKLTKTLDDARKAGMVDWAHIVDRTRFIRKITSFPNARTFLTTQTERYYAEDLWRDQEYYCEFWVEKDAQANVVERPCNLYRVPWMSLRGYASSSELYLAGKRFARQQSRGKSCIMFHLGDHDPSGLDMTRANGAALDMFAGNNGIEVRRVALNMNQVEEHNLLPNPAKESDSRFEEYRDQYGDESWELDALHPRVLNKIITDAILDILDTGDFNAKKAEEARNQATLMAIAEDWDKVKRYLRLQDQNFDYADNFNIGEHFTPNELLSELETDYPEPEPEIDPEAFDVDEDEDEGDDI